jgi:N-acetylneuraminate synthase
MYRKAKVIAEIGCNHMGKLDVAIDMITIASIFCKADAVKFQKRDNQFWAKVKPEVYLKPHPNPKNAYGETYLAHREALEFSIEQHSILKNKCDEMGIEYSCSVWDLNSAKGIASLRPSAIKIPSAANNNYDMLEWLASNYEGEIHVSTGMTSKEEIDELVNFFVRKGRSRDVVLYHCVSGYPVKFEDTYLLEIARMRENYGDVLKDIGYSGHHLGIAIDIAAYTLGANVIERHFTLNRSWKGTDHAASLEPDDLKRLKINLDATFKALKCKEVDILDFELEQKKKLKFEVR